MNSVFVQAIICLQCGKGFSDALEVAVNWLCDDCGAKVPNEVVISNTAAPSAECCAGCPECFAVYDPIWRGEFNIWNIKHNLFGGMAAHLSVKASPMVSEEAKLFPVYLHLEMIPKADLWPFDMSKPSVDDIALYFRPSEARFAQDFDHLVAEMIGGEFALRAFLPNVELLIFTSTELPLHHLRFQRKYYLWGVCRERTNSSSRQC